MPTRRTVLTVSLAAAALAAPARGEDGVAALIGQLAGERSYAESGAGLLKAWVKKPATILQGQRLYAEAKAASDAANARLVAALAAGTEPDTDVELQRLLKDAAEKRVAFSRHVDASLDALAGKKNVIADALGKAAGEIVKGLITATVDVWKTLRTADQTRRDTLRLQVQAERWKSFGVVPAA
jgi:hypothetical protein